MRTTPLVLAASAAALALAAPAHADHTTQECGFQSFQQGNVTNDRYTGEAEGHIVGAPGEAVSIACEIRVNGVAVDATSRGTGTTAAVTVGVIRYFADDDDTVDICALVTHAHGSGEFCQSATNVDRTPPL